MTNTDQGSQFTSEQWTAELTKRGMTLSMDGRGRAYDNIFVERLWRSPKYKEVYLHDSDSPTQAWQGLDRDFRFYNHERPHQGLEDYPPAAVYFNETKKTSRGGSQPPLWPLLPKKVYSIKAHRFCPKDGEHLSLTVVLYKKLRINWKTAFRPIKSFAKP